MSSTPESSPFTGLVDLASAELGGEALAASDDFFASRHNLLLSEPPVFIEGKFTDRGKWMDGWESRRKRGAGHDWCILKLGAAGVVLGLDIDTRHFVGNHPPFAAVEGLRTEPSASLEELERAEWTELLRQSPLRPGSHNLFAAEAAPPMSHLRLRIFPDGGVARFRAYGRVHAEWRASEPDGESRPYVKPGMVDLAALQHGALALACSDAFFGPMNNLILPGLAANMGGGWETRRKRHAGHDWILVQLAAAGSVRVVEVSTQHFKGNYPDRCSIELIAASGARITDLLASSSWRPLLPEVKLDADTRHFFTELVVSQTPATHARLNIYPDGGVSRLRLWGERA